MEFCIQIDIGPDHAPPLTNFMTWEMYSAEPKFPNMHNWGLLMHI